MVLGLDVGCIGPAVLTMRLENEQVKATDTYLKAAAMQIFQPGSATLNGKALSLEHKGGLADLLKRMRQFDSEKKKKKGGFPGANDLWWDGRGDATNDNCASRLRFARQFILIQTLDAESDSDSDTDFYLELVRVIVLCLILFYMRAG